MISLLGVTVPIIITVAIFAYLFFALKDRVPYPLDPDPAASAALEEPEEQSRAA